MTENPDISNWQKMSASSFIKKPKKLEWALEDMVSELTISWGRCLSRVEKLWPKMLVDVAENTDGLKEAIKQCESPIEVRLLAGILSHNWGTADKPIHTKLVTDIDEFYKPDYAAKLILQQLFKGFRPDFLMRMNRRATCVYMAIEADGRAYHLDKEKDQRRDKIISDSGVHVIRLTGREITNSLFACTKEIDDFAWRLEK